MNAVSCVRRALARIGRRREAEAWDELDETTLSRSERRFVEEGTEGHHTDAVVQAAFGGGNPDRLLDFPPGK